MMEILTVRLTVPMTYDDPDVCLTVAVRCVDVMRLSRSVDVSGREFHYLLALFYCLTSAYSARKQPVFFGV